MIRLSESVSSARASVASAPVAGQSGASLRSLGSLSISFGPQSGGVVPVGQVELLIPTAQFLTVQQGNLQRILRPGQDLLVLPGGVEAPQPFQGWRLRMELERLCQLAASLSQHRLSPARFRRALQQERAQPLRLPPERELGVALLHLLEMTLSPATPQLELVGFDRMIQRLVVVILCGDLIQAARHDDEPARGSKSRIVDELLRWIEANLDRSIQLQDLERQSGYSQRSLRNFFQERFGCGPVQWIRSRRLEAARQRLLNPEARDSVSSIAARYGYSYLSQFSRDFQQAYQVRPSDLLREGLRGRSDG